MIEPIDAPISQEWGLTRFARDNSHVYPNTAGHCGRDYASLDGTDVVAPENGTIVHVGLTDIESFGEVVQIEAEGRTHWLCHLTPGSAVLAVGDEVGEGDLLALSGHSPNWAPHLHWEIRGGGPSAMRESIDPRTLLTPERYTREALQSYAAQAGARAGIDGETYARQINQESGWQPYAHSGADAVGIAQIVPRWHPTVNPWDPYAALDYAANLMASHLETFGSYDLALAAYNAGPGAVRQYGGVPPFEETRNYVRSILGEETVKPVATIFDDPDFWLKAKWEELSQTAIGVVNRAKGGVEPTDDESRFLNNRYKDLIEDWPRLLEAEKQRTEVN